MTNARIIHRIIALTLFLSGAGATAAETASRRGKTSIAALPFELDAGRILIEARFQTADGGERKALAWFNMGMPAPILTKALFRELAIDRGAQLRLRIGDTVLEAAAESIIDGDGGLGAPSFAQNFGPLPIEAMIPASLFLKHRLTLDYRRHALILTDNERAEGAAIPMTVNPTTGLASVVAKIDGQDHPFVIDAGSGYCWMRGAVLASWLKAHPDWRRAEGAIGAANYNMLDLDFEKRGTLARIPSLSIGALELKNIGFFGTGPILGGFVDDMIGDFFWDNWQKSAPDPVVGWLGANILQGYALTLDYPNHMSYWRANGAADSHDLDSVGVTLTRRDGRYFIGAVTPPVEGVAVGDEVIAVGDMPAAGATKGGIIAALHGKAGDIRRLALTRDGAAREVDLPVLDLR